MSASHLVLSVVAALCCALANGYIHARFFTQIFPRAKALSAAVCAAAFCSNIVFLFTMRTELLPSSAYALLAAVMGFSFFFFLVAIVYDLFKFIAFLCKRNRPKISWPLLLLFFKNYEQFSRKVEPDALNKLDSNRRRLIKFLFNLGFLFIAASCFAKGLYNALKIPPLRLVKISAPNAPKLRIAMVSDLHLGRNLHEDFLRGVISRINAAKPDVVVICGDLIDTDVRDISYLSALDELAAPAFYCSGNHEFYHGAPEIFSALKSTKITQLHNATADFGEGVSISGLEDLYGQKYGFSPDISALRPDKQKFNILLTHQPKTAKIYDLSAFDLVLAGHTHAGQIFPFSLLVLAQQGFLYGLYRLGARTQMYVSSGAGFWGPSVRFLAPSEIAILEINHDK